MLYKVNLYKAVPSHPISLHWPHDCACTLPPHDLLTVCIYPFARDESLKSAEYELADFEIQNVCGTVQVVTPLECVHIPEHGGGYNCFSHSND